MWRGQASNKITRLKGMERIRGIRESREKMGTRIDMQREGETEGKYQASASRRVSTGQA